MQEKDPRPVVFIDKFGRPRWHEVFHNNPRLRKKLGPQHQISNNRGGNRPYIKRVTPDRYFWVEQYGPPRGEVYLTGVEAEYASRHAGRLIIEPNLKASAPPNKDWGFDRWQRVVDALPGLPWTQVGPLGTRTLRGVDLVETPTFRHALSVMSLAMAYVGHEGGLHHAAAAFGRKAVVVFGGFISPAQTGYADHVNLFGADEPCGIRRPCEHCRKAMNRITVEQVTAAVQAL